jgi:hypothetical protein
MNNQTVQQAPMTPVAPIYPPPQTTPGGCLSEVVYADEAEGPTKEWEPEFRETFSKGILKMKLREYWGGKITQKYVETYLEFMHLSGMVDNLEFLEYKNVLEKGQL